MPEPTTPEQKAEWAAWLAERPPGVRRVAEKFPPWKDYRLKSTGQHCVLRQYDEHEGGSVTVRVFAWYDWLGPVLGHDVFGINPEDLEER